MNLIHTSQDADKIIATINPYSPIHSAKIRISTIPTKISSVYAYAFTPASPAAPIANPDASPLNPQQRPAPKNLYPVPELRLASAALADKRMAIISP